MYDDLHFSNKSWWQLAGMDVRSYNQMESVFIEMLDFEFMVSQKYYNKYWESLLNFIQDSQGQLKASYEQILKQAYQEQDAEAEI